jgi:DNA polymerase epsilon subunit 1
VKNVIKPRVDKNKLQEEDIYNIRAISDYLDYILDIREYDVPYHSRVCIDLDIRMALWYKVSFRAGLIHKIDCIKEMCDRPHLTILAFDIETTKLPLKFPDAKMDCVMQLSINVDGDSILINNR